MSTTIAAQKNVMTAIFTALELPAQYPAVCLSVTDQGLKSAKVDAEHIYLVGVQADKSLFTKCESNEDVMLDANKVLECISQAYENDIVEIRDVEHTEDYGISFQNLSRTMPRSYCRSIKYPPISVFKETYDVKVDDLLKLLRCAQKINDQIEIIASGEKLDFIARKSIRSKDKLSYSQSITAPKEACKSTMNSELFYKALTMFHTLGAESLELKLGTECPIQLATDLYGGKLKIKYLQAPRANSD